MAQRRGRPRGRDGSLREGLLPTLAVVSLGAVVWLGVSAMAVVAFVGNLSPRGSLLFDRELLGFASAFAVASAVGGAAAAAIYGRRGWALGLAFLLVALLAISLVGVRWGVARLTGPSMTWFQSEWGQSKAVIGLGGSLGVLCGLIAFALVGGFAALSRRGTTWRVGLLVAALAAVLGFLAVPRAVPWLMNPTIEYANWNLGYGYDEAIRGAAVGAVLGALVGSVASALVVRTFGRWARA